MLQESKEKQLSFINKLMEKSYCNHFGRSAKEPEMMMKLLFPEYLYNLSPCSAGNLRG